jgi:hypothetical protein
MSNVDMVVRTFGVEETGGLVVHDGPQTEKKPHALDPSRRCGLAPVPQPGSNTRIVEEASRAHDHARGAPYMRAVACPCSSVRHDEHSTLRAPLQVFGLGRRLLLIVLMVRNLGWRRQHDRMLGMGLVLLIRLIRLIGLILLAGWSAVRMSWMVSSLTRRTTVGMFGMFLLAHERLLLLDFCLRNDHFT